MPSCSASLVLRHGDMPALKGEGCQQTSPWGSIGSAKAQEEESKQCEVVRARMGLRVM